VHRFVSNIGPADELMDRVLSTLGTTTGILSVPIEGSIRSVVIRSITVQHDEFVVKCTDIGDESTIVLHIPRMTGSAAQADIISFTEGA
jgi:hypothetical protein